MDRIKRLSDTVLDEHKSKFGEDFADNKKALDEVSIVRSKGLKNEIAGYITKFIKKEIREEKAKQDRIDAAKAEQQTAEESETAITQNIVTAQMSETVAEPAPEQEESHPSEIDHPNHPRYAAEPAPEQEESHPQILEPEPDVSDVKVKETPKQEEEPSDITEEKTE